MNTRSELNVPNVAPSHTSLCRSGIFRHLSIVHCQGSGGTSLRHCPEVLEDGRSQRENGALGWVKRCSGQQTPLSKDQHSTQSTPHDWGGTGALAVWQGSLGDASCSKKSLLNKGTGGNIRRAVSYQEREAQHHCSGSGLPEHHRRATKERAGSLWETAVRHMNARLPLSAQWAARKMQMHGRIQGSPTWGRCDPSKFLEINMNCPCKVLIAGDRPGFSREQGRDVNKN